MADVAGRVRVVDGDTFSINGTAVRLHGIDAPETDQRCTAPDGVDWACGEWVSAQVAALYDGKRASCAQLDTDRYGRVVARCMVRGQDVGADLVRRGLAFAYRRYSMAYDLDEKRAAVMMRGLHAHDVQSPADFRAAQVAARPVQTAPTNCAIKGNISQSGRIFHMPGQADYARTRINPARGERWFCSAADARAAGWRAAKR